MGRPSQEGVQSSWEAWMSCIPGELGCGHAFSCNRLAHSRCNPDSRQDWKEASRRWISAEVAGVAYHLNLLMSLKHPGFPFSLMVIGFKSGARSHPRRSRLPQSLENQLLPDPIRTSDFCHPQQCKFLRLLEYFSDANFSALCSISVRPIDWWLREQPACGVHLHLTSSDCSHSPSRKRLVEVMCFDFQRQGWNHSFSLPLNFSGDLTLER